jgi:MSHA biogenesis protein MshE
MARPERVRLGDLLVREQLITDEQIQQALVEQKRSGRKLGRIFIDSGFVTETQIAKALARQLRVEFVELNPRTLRPEVAKLLPEVQARRLRALPVEETPHGVRVAMADPTDLAAYDELTRLLKREIELVVAAESALLNAIDRSYHNTEQIAGLAQALTSEISSVQDEFADLLGLSSTTAEDAPVVKLLHSVFEEALRLRASDIHIEPQEKKLKVRYRIDGILFEMMNPPHHMHAAIISRLKIMSNLDISERRLPQDGRFHVKLRNGTVDVRISTMPTQHGESVVMRLLAQSANGLSLEGLKAPPAVDAAIRRAIARPSGMVLVTGPTGSGKTTTLYAALNSLNSTERKIITVEDPVEYRLPGLNQVQVMDKIELTFDRVLRAALRQDPDVVLVGEMRDRVTAEIGMRAALTGHLVLSTLHTNDALSTPLRLIDMGVPRYMVALSLQLVLAQRLLRVICPHCAEEIKPEPHEREWLKLELGDAVDAQRFRRGRGCSACNDTGYSGRTGVYEFIEMTQGLVEAMNHGDPAHFTQVARRQMGGNTLRRDAVRLVCEGRTTIDEAMRIATQLDE